MVSKLLPMVSTVTEPVEGAVQVHQRDLPPTLPAWFGSPDSFVARELLAVTVLVLPVRVKRLVKLSLDGGTEIVRVRFALAVLPAALVTLNEYVPASPT